MPSYRSSGDEYRRMPKTNWDYAHKPEEDDDDDEEQDDMPMKEPAKEMKPSPKKQQCICKVECPFKVIVKVIPCCKEDKDFHCDD